MFATAPITLPLKKKPRTIKVKVSKKKTIVAEIFSKPSATPSPGDVVPIIQVFAPTKTQSAQPISAQPIFVVPSTASSSSHTLFSPRPKIVIIRDLFLETTMSRLDRPSVTVKGKGKKFSDPIGKEEDGGSIPKSSVQTRIDMYMEEIDDFID